ncbi:AAA domain-containing protein [Pseudarthrobacter oxydans]|uniref:AAA domain-containing protein n=1 Tax=Pseudarthrobacter oxydans TaxID=1671 RepID=UPI003D2B0608
MNEDTDVNPGDSRAQVLRLIDFLSEYDAQRNRPVRNIEEYALFRLREKALPVHEAIQLHTSESEWLGVDFVDLPRAPEVPGELEEYIAAGAPLSPLVRPALLVSEPVFQELVVTGDLTDPSDDQDPTEESREAQLEEYARLVEAAETWVQDEWEPWAEQYSRASGVKKIHRSVFEQREKLILDRESVELVWGFGRARWVTEGYTIDHPLITVPVEVSLDQKTQRLSVTPAGQTEVEIRYLAGLSIHDRPSITAARQGVTELDLNPWNSAETSELLRRLARSINDRGTVVDDATTSTSVLVVDESWTLYMRPRVPDSQGFLDEMRTIYLTDGTIPEPLRNIVTDPGKEPNNSTSHNQPGHTAISSEPLLLPLATNEEQKRILELSQTHPGVTVQGPPGTGKSHTIANLISHYVAYGKRVLVVAEKEQALRVLADKVPSGIRDLTVSVLGADEESRKSLEKSVTTIQSKVGTLDTGSADDAIARLRKDLDAANRGIASTTADMLRARQAEVLVAPGAWHAGDDISPQTAAEWVRRHATTHSFIPDFIPLSAPLPLSEPEFDEYFRLLKAVGLERAKRALTVLPPVAKLPSTSELDGLFSAIATGESRAGAVRASFFDWQRFVTSSPDAVRATRSHLVSYIESLTSIESSPFAPRITAVWDDLLMQELADYYNALSGLRQQAIEHRRALIASTIQCQEPATQELLRRIIEAQKQLASTGRLGFFDFQHRSTLSTFRIDGRVPATAEEADLCVRSTLLDIARENISRIFGNQSPNAHLVSLSSKPEDDVASELLLLQKLLKLPQLRQEASSELQSLGLLCTDLTSSAACRRLLSVLDEAAQHFEAVQSSEKIKLLEDLLKAGSSQVDASGLWFRLLESVQGQHLDHWSDLRSEALSTTALVESARRTVDLHSVIADAAPRWAEVLSSAPDAAPEVAEISGAWQWRQLENWVQSVTAEASPAELQARIDDLGRQRHRTVAQLVEALAWRRLADNLGPSQRQALQGYLKAVTRYGKTGGKYAQRWMREMRESLNDSKEVVPVWIMTTSRALTSFRPSATPAFDVLIVDEASQIGFEALPLLSLAKKAIVVGDDKQTSPEHVGLDRQKIFDIMDDHLASVPKYRTLFDPDNSLYDLATQKFATPVMLSEHFRCLPEIIAFSNTHAYNRQIVPLRDQPPAPGWVPLGVVRVKDGYRSGDVNEPEALQVANLIAEMCSDEKYGGMTFGVVTLLGSSQAKLIWEKLYDQLGPEQLEERKIRCGEAANFQGDERDVIVISTVVAIDPSQTTTRFGAMTSVKDLRKINVAASRARNQMWVVTSVDPEMLPQGDLRAALIRHCATYVSDAPAQAELLAACESEFERRIINELLGRGYRAIEVQKTVGRYRLDIVVSGPERRLAIECDGDRWHGPDVWYQDRARQEVLERSGWTFERIRGSAYFRDPESAMTPVWEHLNDLGIPTGDEWMEGPTRSVIREVTMADLPNPEPRSSDDEKDTEGPSDAEWDEFLDSLSVPGSSNPTSVEHGTEAEGDPPAVVEQAQIHAVVKVMGSAPDSEPIFEDENSSEQAFSQDSTPSRQYVDLAPYKVWPLVFKPPVADRNIAYIQQGLVEILGYEGPMIARQAYLRYQQATGGHRVGKSLQSIFNVATSRALRAGSIARLNDGIPGVVGSTLYIPGQDPVLVRQLGPRTIFEVPKSELTALLELLSASGVAEWELDREILNAYGLRKLTKKTKEYLQECRTYTWHT